MGDCVKSLAEVAVDNMYYSPLICLRDFSLSFNIFAIGIYSRMFYVFFLTFWTLSGIQNFWYLYII